MKLLAAALLLSLTASATPTALGHNIYTDGGIDVVARVNVGAGVGLEGVATASLPACNATAPLAGGTRGLAQYDTSTNELKYCNGTAYVTVIAAVETLAGATGATTTEETPFAATNAVHTGTGTTVRFVTTTTGVAGAGNAVLEILDGASQRCTLTIACNVAVGTISAAACTGARTAGNNIIAQWDSTSDCATFPLGNVNAPWQ